MTTQQIDSILSNEGTQTGQIVKFGPQQGIITGVKADIMMMQFNYRPVQFNRADPLLQTVELV